MGISFEWTIKFGDILTFIGLIAAAASFLYRRGGQETGMHLTLEALALQFAEMKTEFKTFGETLQTVAVQEVKIGLLMKWYDELRHGQGFVRGSRTSVDGEYPPS